MRRITKHGLMMLILMTVFVSLFSAPVSTDKAVRIAEKAFRAFTDTDGVISFKRYHVNGADTLFIEVEFNDDSFVIVSCDDSAEPIMGYSTESGLTDYDDHPALSEMFTSWTQEISYARLNNLQNPLASQKWQAYENNDIPTMMNERDAVSPLLSTTWNQGWPYNKYCPSTSSGGSGGHVWAGCVATAMAQVMKFYNFPDQGTGSHSYYHSTYGTQSANFNTTYDWAGMPTGYGNDEIAKLMRHLGVAVNMDYDPSGSGAYSSVALSAMKTYFGYESSARLAYKNSYSTTGWINVLKTELNAGRPLYYHGYGTGGHAFNVDGYNSSNYFHLNWGWGGYYNGYFLITDLTPGSMNFTSSQGAFVGLQPAGPLAPTDIELSYKIVMNGNVIGDVVGELSTTDSNPGDTFTYTLPGTASDNSYFSISGSSLVLAHNVDADLKSSYNIKVRSTDSDGLYIEVDFLILALKQGMNFIAKSNYTGYMYLKEQFGEDSQYIGNWSGYTIHVGDFNGDGKDDYLAHAPDGRLYYRHDLNSSSTYIGNWSGYKIYTGDFNGDGKDDYLGQAPDGKLYYRHDFNQSSTYIGNWSGYKLYVGDFNGDGKDDYLGHAPDGRLYHRPDFTQSSTYIGNWSGYKIYVGDFNGDGKDDYLGHAPDGRLYYRYDFDQNSTYIGNWSGYKILVGDFNGDGKDDYLGHAPDGRLYYRYDFYQSSKYIGNWSGYSLFIGDFDSDGTDDYLGQAPDGGLYYRYDFDKSSIYMGNWAGYKIYVGDFSGNIMENNGNQLTGPVEPEENVAPFEFMGNYPNPCNPETNISFNINEDDTNVRVKIYNMKGQIVRNLINENFDKGSHSVKWLGKDEHDNQVGSGVYFYKISSGSFTKTCKLTVLK